LQPPKPRVSILTDDRQKHQVSAEPAGRKIAFVVLGNQQWPTLRRYVDRVLAAVNAATPGSFAEVEIPFE
jgi:hypothetical protein